MGAALPLRIWTVDEYDRIVAAGVLGERERVELVEGEIVEMAPVGDRHAACVDTLAGLLRGQVPDHLVVRVQRPVHLSPRSEPRPDLAVVASPDELHRDPGEVHPDDRDRGDRHGDDRHGDDRHGDELPEATSVLLAVEVAETSVATERDVKMPLYARAGIAESWLVDLEARTVEVYQQPSPDGYGIRQEHGAGKTVVAGSVEGLAVAVDQLVRR